jgi:hypothetical protein
MLKNKIIQYIIKNKKYIVVSIIILFIIFKIYTPPISDPSKCTSKNAFIYENTNTSLIERKTIKSILSPNQTAKLMEMHEIFRPSLMYGTYCNTIYTDYYDFVHCKYEPDIYNKIKKDLLKRVRIRHYYFDPNKYFELKYKNSKIRVLIDDNYNILEPDSVDKTNKILIETLLKKIKNGTLKKLFYNEYKRYSYIYKSDSSTRITIDRNIRLEYLEYDQILNFDILEVKYNINTPEHVILNQFKEIEKRIGSKIIFSDFSKVDYTTENIIAPTKVVNMLGSVNW